MIVCEGGLPIRLPLGTLTKNVDIEMASSAQTRRALRAKHMGRVYVCESIALALLVAPQQKLQIEERGPSEGPPTATKTTLT